MILKCVIDGTQYTFNVNTDKPLNKILEEQIEAFPSNNRCNKAACGNCLIIFNDSLRFSCLIPAFEAENATILTFEGFKNTRGFHDIERAYEQTGNKPCPLCYKPKTLIIETLVSKMEQLNNDFESDKILAHNRKTLKTLDKVLIEKELETNPCKCMEINDIEKIVNLAYSYRSSRRVRKPKIS